jgi:hypothetical protein
LPVLPNYQYGGFAVFSVFEQVREAGEGKGLINEEKGLINSVASGIIAIAVGILRQEFRLRRY